LKTVVLKQWLALWASVGAVLLAAIFGFAQEMFQRDHSYLTTGIIALYFLCTWTVLQLVRKARDGKLSYARMKPIWFATEAMLAAGIVGNAIGLYWQLSGFFGADLTNAAIKAMLQGNVVIGLATACLVTMMGVGCSYALKTQLVAIELALDLQAELGAGGAAA
jgi:hypothetical protein